MSTQCSTPSAASIMLECGVSILRLRALAQEQVASATRTPDSLWKERIAQALRAAAIKELSEILPLYPQARLIYHRDRILIPGIGGRGFAMALSFEGGRCKLAFGAWHDDFGSAQDAVAYIADALSGDLRLKVVVGTSADSWTLERRMQNGMWLDESVVTVKGRCRAATTAGPLYFSNGA